jgi:hypothetical protein
VYVRALALVVALAAAQLAWGAYADHAAQSSASTAFSKDWTPVATRAAVLMAPPLSQDAGNAFGSAKGMVLARMPSEGFGPEPMLRR